MKTVSLRIPAALDARLQQLAQQREQSKSELVREALESYLVNGTGQSPTSVYELTRDLCGSVEGPRDLATNPKHLDGYGR